MQFLTSKRNRAALIVTLFVACFGLAVSCGPKPARIGPQEVPKINLWAWERPEDLRWLEGKEDIGVAYLAQTLTLTGDDVDVRPRMQPLRVPRGSFLTAVTRIETKRSVKQRPKLSRTQLEEVRKSVLSTLDHNSVKAVQIDFDAASSERTFYTELLHSIRLSIPKDVPFSMTALASWCIGDRWLAELPVDEAVPMVFDMGTDDKTVRQFLKNGNDWPEPLCRSSYGLASYDAVHFPRKPFRRYYYFNNRAWRESDIKSFLEEN